MTEGGRLDILSMALQQTGVEQSSVSHNEAPMNDFLPPDLNSFLGENIMSGFSPTPTPMPVKQERSYSMPMIVTNVPVHRAQDPLSQVCASYLPIDPPQPPTTNIKVEPHSQVVSYNGTHTGVKSEPMDFSQSSNFNLEDIDLDDFLHTPSDSMHSTEVFPSSSLVANSFLELQDDDLSRLLDDVVNTTTPTFSGLPGNEYSFPPRRPPPQYNMSYNGRRVTATQQLVTPSASVNGPNGTHYSPHLTRPSNPLQNHQHVVMKRSPPAVQKFKLEPKPQVPEVPAQGEDESDDEEETFATADTYTNYQPTKLKIGLTHPDPVVESSSLSSVEPPQVWFDLKLPQQTIDERKLSSLQLESIVYACQQHMNILTDGSRAGFLVGDGAGVGKGRTIAGIIYQNYLEGRKKAVWLSVSNDLKFDAIRDLKDVGAKKIDVYSLNKFHYGKISGKRNGRVRKGVVFATYASLIGESSSGGKYRTRFNQLLHWLGSHYEGIIVFDECHKAKNLVPSGAGKPSKTGLTVLELQKKLPKARIVYCSATGASEPKNMAYMSRLGIWGKGTQFPTFQQFIKAVEGRGVGAMEMVAMDMKLRGMYMARQLSFSGVKFSITEVELSPEFVEAYNASVELWIEARRLFQEASDFMDFDKKKNKTMWGQFWAAHQRFFKYMCIAAKVPETIRHARQCLTEGKCVVIGLQSTGEARTMEQLEQEDGELTGFVSTIKGVLDTLIRRHFPTPSSGIDWSVFNDDPSLPRSCRKRRRTTRPRGQMFQEDDAGSSDTEDSSGRGSDSAVESSSDEGERSSGDSGSSTSESENGSGTEDADDYNPFGGDMNEPWLKKKAKAKPKKTKPGPPKKKRKNFSIKAPPTSNRKGCKTKTGFNSKSLQFEPVNSPLGDAIKKPPLLPPPTTLHPLTSHTSLTPSQPRKSSVVTAPSLGEHRNIVDAMSAKFSLEGLAPGPDSRILGEAAVRKMKEDLLRKLDLLSPHLPTNTLDELIDGLGGPRKVAEMTGRRGRVVSAPDGSIQYQLRSEGDVSIELLNIAEKQRFMDGQKDIAIISEAASSGISLQADKRAKNQKLRVHITLELPWSADRAIQQFGRTHRSNQVSAPEYIFLISRLSGEQRFASIVAKRLESLGALTHGDRRATESRDLSKYNVDTKYGRQALETTIRSIVGTGSPLVTTEEFSSEFFDECRNGLVGAGLLNKDPLGLVTADKDSMTMSRFLNRILGLSVVLQNKLFAYFSDTLAAVIKNAKRMGKYDVGIMDFGATGESVEIAETLEFLGDPAFGTATTQLHRVKVERGMAFSEALDRLDQDHSPGEGFYISKRVRNDKQVAILLKSADSQGKLFSVFRPNTGQCLRTEKMSRVLEKYTKASDTEEAEKCWNSQYESSTTICTHAFWRGRCRQAILNNGCEVGLRQRTYHVLSGSILGVWSHVEGVFNRNSSSGQRMQIVRVRAPQKRLVGIQVPNSFVDDMRKTLERVASQAMSEHNFGTADNPIQL